MFNKGNILQLICFQIIIVEKALPIFHLFLFIFLNKGEAEKEHWRKISLAKSGRKNFKNKRNWKQVSTKVAYFGA